MRISREKCVEAPRNEGEFQKLEKMKVEGKMRTAEEAQKMKVL